MDDNRVDSPVSFGIYTKGEEGDDGGGRRFLRQGTERWYS